MLKIKIVLKARPATENTATLTIISTRVQADARFGKGLIDIVLNSVSGDESAIGAVMLDAAVGPIHCDRHQYEIGVNDWAADVRVALGNPPVVSYALLACGR